LESTIHSATLLIYMHQTVTGNAPTLVIVLANGSSTESQAADLAFRYAETAAAMDYSVEIHVVGKAVRLFQKFDKHSSHLAGVPASSMTERLQRANELGVKLYVCSAALADAQLALRDLIDEVSGVRGAASLLAAGMSPQARLLSF
jgi:predicted peroxiredoxin